MSAYPKADIDRGHWNVRFVPIADIAITSSACARNVGGIFGDCTGARVSAPD